jgi:glycosyltransferase involved in cell wall biosynthesis
MPVGSLPHAQRACHLELETCRTRWLSVVSHLDPKYGGLSAVVPQLASVLCRRSSRHPGGATDGAAAVRQQVELAAFCLPSEQHVPGAAASLSVSFWPTSRREWVLDRSLGQRFRARVAAVDGLHIHGLWEQSTLVAARTARACDKPYIVSAHGMLEPWALARSRSRKQIYATLFERANLEGAACLHALTQAEAEQYRSFGARGPIAVIPNGVEVPKNLNPRLFLDKFPAARNKRMVLYLGRFHQKKGIDLLVRAWSRMACNPAEACLVLAGPSEDGTRGMVEQLVHELGIADSVIFPGMLGQALKWSALAAAECFVLPSYSEGLSVAALEAMGAGLPVIVTENCNLPEVIEHNAGWQVRARVEEIAAALEACLGNSPGDNHESGRRGAALVRQRYSWSAVAAQMAELYRWVAGGPEPQGVDVQQGRRHA